MTAFGIVAVKLKRGHVVNLWKTFEQELKLDEKQKEDIKRDAWILIVFNCLFYILWGVANWGDDDVWSFAWLFDELGHGLWNSFHVLWLLHLLVSYTPAFFGRYKLAAYLVTFAVSFIVSVPVWEFFEFTYDLLRPFFGWHATAQKGNLDTMVDFGCSIFGGVLGLFIRYRWDTTRENRYPEDRELDRQDLAIILHANTEQRLAAQRIRQRHRDHLYNLEDHLLPTTRKVLRFIQGGRHWNKKPRKIDQKGGQYAGSKCV